MADDELEPLVTECPNCSTRFRVTDSQLQVAGGRVRCGACLTVFQGVDHLLWDDDAQFASPQEAQDALDELLNELTRSSEAADEAASAAAEPEVTDLAAANPFLPDDKPLYVGFEDDAEDTTAAPPSPAWTTAAGRPDDAAGDSGPLPAAPSHPEPQPSPASPKATGADGDAPEPPVDELPTEAVPVESAAGPATAPEPPSARSNAGAGALPANARSYDEALPESLVFEPERRRWWMPLALLVALLALVLQVFWFQYPQWSRDPALRPVYEVACRALGCSLPQRRDLAAVSSRSLVVRSHPDVTGALIVDALIVNEAPYAQPFPVLELEFRDLNQNPVASGRFPPEVYLDGELAGAELMPSRTPIHVDLEIEDPGEDAVNYFLYFR